MSREYTVSADYAWVDIEELTREIDPVILSAAKEVDTSQVQMLLEMTPLERVQWSAAAAQTIRSFKK